MSTVQKSTLLRVLFIEDSADDAALLLRVLQRAGYNVAHERVETAQALREAVERQSWDIILADYSLPRFTAPEALAELQKLGSEVPMIVVSGSVGEQTAVDMMKSGAADYIMKDTLARLVPAVEREVREAVVRRERGKSQAQVRRHLEHVAALRAVDSAIGRGIGLSATLDVLLDQISSQLDADAAAVLLLDPGDNILRYAAGRGFKTDGAAAAQLRLGDAFAGQVADTSSRIPASGLLDIDPDNNPGLPAQFLAFVRTEGFLRYAAEPLVAKDRVRGVLEVFMRQPFEPEDDWLHLLNALAAQAGIAIESAAMVDELQRFNKDLVQAYDTTLEGWSRALDLRDHETEGHTRRVTEMAVRLGRRMGMSDDELVQVRRGALLHDIGKMGIPDSILLKPGPLSDSEWEVMRRHPVYARELLSPISFLNPALAIPHCHHERWDGTGYPRGLAGELIPLAARVFAVVDVFDALRSDRPYRAGWSHDATIQHLKTNSGTHFDPSVVEAFLQMLQLETPPG